MNPTTCSREIVFWVVSIAMLASGIVTIWWAITGSMVNKRRGTRWAVGLLGLLMIAAVSLNTYVCWLAASKGIVRPTISILEMLGAMLSGAVGGVFVTLVLFGELTPKKPDAKGMREE